VLERPGSLERNGVGAIRALHLLGPPTREQVTEYDPPRRLRYRLLSGLPFRHYVGEVTVAPSGAGSSVTTEVCFRTLIPGTQVFGPIALRLATRGAVRLAERRSHELLEPP
jgi:hypothetical protein